MKKYDIELRMKNKLIYRLNKMGFASLKLNLQIKQE
jgi:hypothetical protein